MIFKFATLAVMILILKTINLVNESRAQKHGIKVMVDLHGAPGSQNGFDNSGRAGPIKWQDDPRNVERTLDAVKVLAEIFIPYPSVETIQILNEPAGWALNVDAIAHFNQNAAESIKEVNKLYFGQPNPPLIITAGATETNTSSIANTTSLDIFNTTVVISNAQNRRLPMKMAFHDAFLSWNPWARYDYGNETYIDTHSYHAFSNEFVAFSEKEHLRYTCNVRRGQVASAQNYFLTITGKFTLTFGPSPLIKTILLQVNGAWPLLTVRSF
jgi:aryl-phospho-beta-D-glucosidase BglC (GH1 family)